AEQLFPGGIDVLGENHVLGSAGEFAVEADRLAAGVELVAAGGVAPARQQRVGELGEAELLAVEVEREQRQRRQDDAAALEANGDRLERRAALALERVDVRPGVGERVLAPPDVRLAARLPLEEKLAALAH